MIRKLLRNFIETRFPELEIESKDSKMTIAKILSNKMDTNATILVSVDNFETKITNFATYDAKTFEMKTIGYTGLTWLTSQSSVETKIEEASEKNIDRTKTIINNFIGNIDIDRQINSCEQLIGLEHKNIERIESKINRINTEIEFYNGWI